MLGKICSFWLLLRFLPFYLVEFADLMDDCFVYFDLTAGRLDLTRVNVFNLSMVVSIFVDYGLIW